MNNVHLSLALAINLASQQIATEDYPIPFEEIL